MPAGFPVKRGGLRLSPDTAPEAPPLRYQCPRAGGASARTQSDPRRHFDRALWKVILSDKVPPTRKGVCGRHFGGQFYKMGFVYKPIRGR
jgi:hypothetical protein